jgi:hypothetical protein
VAGGEQVGVLLAVALELLLVLVAVELGDQPLRAPEHVDLIAGDGGVDLGQRESIPADESQERVLEERARRPRRLIGA